MDVAMSKPVLQGMTGFGKLFEKCSPKPTNGSLPALTGNFTFQINEFCPKAATGLTAEGARVLVQQ